MHLWRQAFERHLRETLGENLQLIWTQNRRVMISLQHKKGTPVLRLHESFATAAPELKSDLVRFLVRGRRLPESVRDFVKGIAAHGGADREKLAPRGRNYDLRKIHRKLNREYFGNRLKGNITWGRKAFGDQKRSITFGSYFSERNLIRIHPVLDTELVPLFYLESVVHHEMVHEYLETVEGAGRKHGQVHTSRFRELERQFKFFELAAAWEKRHLPKLLRYRPILRK